jgi:hypothetical protein
VVDHEAYTGNMPERYAKKVTDSVGSGRSLDKVVAKERDMKETDEADDMLPRRMAAASDIRMLAGKEPASRFLSPATEILVKNVQIKIKDIENQDPDHLKAQSKIYVTEN